jgi:hypothetical protein
MKENKQMARTQRKQEQPVSFELRTSETSLSQKGQGADDWSLSAEQMAFMLEHHNIIEQAYEQQDLTAVRKLAKTKSYKQIFGDMSWDEAYDRYEEFLLTGSDSD